MKNKKPAKKPKTINKKDRLMFETQIEAFELYIKNMKDHITVKRYKEGQELLLDARLMLALNKHHWVDSAYQDLLHWWEDQPADDELDDTISE